MEIMLIVTVMKNLAKYGYNYDTMNSKEPSWCQRDQTYSVFSYKRKSQQFNINEKMIGKKNFVHLITHQL